jgi:preprotein translocase subunit SecG
MTEQQSGTNSLPSTALNQNPGQMTAGTDISSNGAFSSAPRIEVSFPTRRSIYYSVTDSEINMYATLGWIATICLTLFGAFVGAAFGGWVALQQGNMPTTTTATLTTLMVITGIVSAIFLALSIFFMITQAKSKKDWQARN